MTQSGDAMGILGLTYSSIFIIADNESIISPRKIIFNVMERKTEGIVLPRKIVFVARNYGE
jgi:hypothetical protein